MIKARIRDKTMPEVEQDSLEYIERYKDGSVKAKGPVLNGNPSGYWEWFRKDGSKMRSGYFDNGKPDSEWITYDRQSNVYKITQRKAD